MGLFQKTNKRQILELPISDIRANPHQPRRDFTPGDLAELAMSISQVGILQPLSVRRIRNGWELIAGERRLRAAVLAGLTSVPCLPIEADDDTSALLALVPMALGLSEGAAEMMSDMSITMISGMVVSTIVTLLFTPVYYSVIDDLSHIFSRKKKKGAPPAETEAAPVAAE